MNISYFEYDSKLYFNIKKLHCFLHQVVYFYYIILLFFLIMFSWTNLCVN
jgi:hypothetical protein